MASRQDDNFDLYDDPYVATAGGGGADPYAEDEDDYYQGAYSGQYSSYDPNPRRDDRSGGRSLDNNPSSNNGYDDYDEESKDPRRDRDRDQSQASARDTSSSNNNYSPQPQRDNSYQQQQPQQLQQQQQQRQQQQSSGQQSYGKPPQQTPYGARHDQGGQYSQKPSSGSQQDYHHTQQQSQQPSSSGGRELGKMFIGGLNWETTDESLRAYFSRYGELTDCMVMKDPVTNKSRGFGFLTFVDPKNVDAVLKEDHYLDGKMIDPKRAIPREEQEKTEKIFVGGIPPEVTEEEFANYFSQFGNVLDATLMLDRNTGRPRGFGFITFESDRGVDAALSRRDLMLHDKTIEVKRAQPKHRAGGYVAPSGGFNPNFGSNQGTGYGGGMGMVGHGGFPGNPMGGHGGPGGNFGMDNM
ncbi:hypothetical protein BGW38_000969, partial [Lunasporangiospora selenospora]